MSFPRTTTARGVAFAVLVLGLAACSGDDDTSDTAAEEQVCDDWAQVRSSVAALGDVDVAADGTDALRSAWDGLSDAVDELGDTAGDQLGDEVDALRIAVGDLGDELRDAADDPADEGAGSGLVAVGEAVQGVTRAADDLGAELQPDCDT
jgi:hypothetical protein